MLEDILRAGEDSAALLEQLRLLPPEELGEERAAVLLQAAIERKLMLSPCGEDGIRNLIIRSVKQSGLVGQGLSQEEVQRRIEQYDCRQTSLVAKKKVLLFFFIEDRLGIRLDDGEAARIQNVPQLAACAVRLMREARAAQGREKS